MCRGRGSLQRDWLIKWVRWIRLQCVPFAGLGSMAMRARHHARARQGRRALWKRSSWTLRARRVVDVLTPSLLLTAGLVVVLLVRRDESLFRVKRPVRAAEPVVDTSGSLAELGDLLSVDATNTIFVFTDYYCPFCREHYEEIERLRRPSARDSW